MPKRTEKRWWEFSGDEKAPSDLRTPDCFTDEEWGAYYEAETQAVWNKKNLRKSIVKDMCEDCTLVYQRSQIREGKCQPQYGVITPLHRIAMIAAGEEDPIEPERKSRAAPWTELPILQRTSVGPEENGTGEEETTRLAGNSMVLSE